MAAPAFGAAGTYLDASTSAASAAVPVPAGVAANDVILVHLYKENAAAVTPPAGFTKLTPAPATTTNVQSHHTFWKRATAGDTGTYSFTWTGSVTRAASAERYTGCVTSGSPIDFYNQAARSSAGTVSPAVSGTTTGADRLLVWAGTSWDASSAWTQPTGWTERVDATDAIGVATLTQAAAGATGSITGTYAASDYQTAMLLALIPASTPASAGNAAGTGAALAPTVNLVAGTTASAGNAAGSGTAETPSVTRSSAIPAGNAAGTGAALTPSIVSGLTVQAPGTSGTGAALTPTITSSSSPAPAAAAGIGAALAPSFLRSSAITQATATGTGAALAPTVGLSTSAGIPFLQTTMGAYFGSTPRLSVEVAWGADIATLTGGGYGDGGYGEGGYGEGGYESSWEWTNISQDVLQAGGSQVVITQGRGDEASTSQPASCKLTLDNRLGAYSLGGQSSNWPNVRRNTPVRVRVDTGDGSGYYVAFQGFATSWSPSWDITGRKATVELTAAGVLRRLAQGQSPVMSAYRRLLTSTTARVVAYWPCEDAKGSTTLASGIADQPAMLIAGSAEQPYPDFASNSDFVASGPLPTVKQTAWRGVVPSYTGGNYIELRFLMGLPEDSISGTTCVLASLYTTGTIARWNITYGIGGTLAVTGYSTAGAAVVSTGAVAFNADNTIRRYRLILVQVGADIVWAFEALGIGYSSPGFTNGTATTQTMGIATGVTIGGALDVGDASIGHIAVLAYPDATAAALGVPGGLEALIGYSGETVDTRIARLCSENAVPITVTGTSEIAMGPQSTGTLLTLLRECEAADQGVLYDGRDAGLTYVCGNERVNASPALTIDASAGELAREFAPVDDDQRNVNKVTAKRTNGSSATVEDTTGPLGTAEIGIYDNSVTVNIDSDSDVIDHAGWAVHLGTQPGYRYPSLQLDLAREPQLAPDLLGTAPSSRVDVLNPATVRALPVDDIPLLVEGITYAIDQFRWDVTLTCSPYTPWRVGTLASTTSDTSELVQRTSSDGSTLNTAAASGATSLSVATPTGPLWTTVADDYPLLLDVGGIKVTATACSGASSPQTFTVTGVTKALPSGLTVDVWQPTVPGV